MGKEYQIVDLDGCISDDRWRRPMIVPLESGEVRGDDDWKRFEAYHNGIFGDNFVNRHELRRDAERIILTSRPLRFHSVTNNWLRSHGITYRFLIMRNNNDRRVSVEVKREQLSWLLDPNTYEVRREEIVDAIDDRLDIVRMYLEAGLPARVVNIDGTEAE